VKRELPEGFELDDDPARVPVDELHAFLSTQAYWALGRPRETVQRLVREADRVVGLYRDGALAGFCRAVTDGVAFVYLADVFVLPEHRGRGLGVELVREMIEHGPYASRRWLLHTADAHRLYEKFGFAAPNARLMERPPRR
jgi:GNAT superfamily N-acetyltransferase